MQTFDNMALSCDSETENKMPFQSKQSPKNDRQRKKKEIVVTNIISEYGNTQTEHYQKSNMRQKILKAKTEFDEIDRVFPQAVDEHVNRIDSWRSYNSDLDGNK